MTPKLRFPEFEDQWQSKLIKEVAEVVGGGTPDTAVNDYWNGDTIWLTPSEVKSRYVSSSQRTITEKGLSESGAKLLPEGSVIFTSRATIGEVAVSTKEMATNQGFQSMIVNEDNFNLFIYYWVLSNKKLFITKSSGSTFPEISRNEMLKIKVILPKKAEQQKIAGFLTTVDDKIASLEKKLDLLKKYKQGVMQKIFSQKVKFNSDGADYARWGSRILGDLIELRMGQSPDSKAYNETGDGLYLIQGNADIQGRTTTPRFWTSDITKTCDVGDIILTVRAPSGYVAISAHKACIGRGVSAIKVREAAIKEFIYQFLLWFEPRWVSIEQGSTFNAISGDDIRGLKLNLPSLEEQQKIADFLATVDDKITVTQNQLTQTKQFKKALLQRMFV